MIKKWTKNEKKTRGKLQFSKKWKIAIFFEFFFIFFHLFLIFFIFFSFFYVFLMFFSFFYVFLMFFSFFFHFFHFFIFLSFFIIFASSGAKIFQKMKNCNFPRVFFHFFHFVFSFFYHCLISFHHFLSFFIKFTTGSKNDKNMIKKKWKKLEENCNFLFFGFFLHHWKRKWWKMIKKKWKMKKW